MGADIRIEKPKDLDCNKLIKKCSKVPIDVDIEGDKIHFHYGYWGESHSLKCELFVSNFANKYKLSLGRWSY